MLAQVVQQPVAACGGGQVAELQSGKGGADFVQCLVQARAHVEVSMENAVGPAAALFHPCGKAQGHLGLADAHCAAEQRHRVGVEDALQLQYLAAAAYQPVGAAPGKLARRRFRRGGQHPGNDRLRLFGLHRRTGA